MKFYLDTSAWVKRYIVETGTQEMDKLFDLASSDEEDLYSSLWNVGECLGVFDKRRNRGDLSQDEFKKTIEKFFRETIDLMERRHLELSPISGEALIGCWNTILDEHIYQADALQLESMRPWGCDALLTGDRKLAEVARGRGYEGICLEKNQDRKKLDDLL
ncbi:hypothetical protein AKJ52_01815 [candidate division MSBL1 archaeon SCGC-AAA382C18]|uniref:PIN domain-containing protein n=1 Tax=candidate division MSBL1 archaeon SCGC-AAA382C18 TaxID=1698281 RepID=A0A133VJT9_9EURY|nr:hypothetical protein AKJ52_01815 [candidate division MSBL1 archaeon SCGC-AAA382C18]